MIGKPHLCNLKRLFRICGSRIYFKSLYSQIQFGGVLLGTVLFGSLSDCFGRKPVSLIALTIGISSQIISGLAPNWQLLLATRFFIGLSIGGTIVVVCTYVMEMILPQQRMALRAFFNWGSARLIITVVCYFFPDWRSASIALALIASPMIIIIIFVFPESPTWLHNKGRLTEMKESEKKMARVAGIKYVEKEPEPIIRKKTVV
jgi:MFS family permease